MDLQMFWFILIAVLWSGYFVLEGFDFGVGMLLPFLPRDEADRRVMFETIGPVWDANEVWLVVAAGATFAAFPAWYGTMFSGFYIALLIILFLLIVRVLSFEWREKRESSRWQAAWLWANVVGSVGVPFVWGVALSTLLYGVPLDSDGDFAGTFFDLFSLYSVFAGIVFVLVFVLHGATFLSLRTEGDLLERALGTTRRLVLPAGLAASALLIWTVAVAVDRNDKDVFPPVLPAVLGIAAFLLAVVFVFSRANGRAFTMTAAAIVLVVATLFSSLYPRVMVSAPDFGNSLTVSSASSSHYALGVMTVAALILTPLILLYQAWTYYVFRARLKGEKVEPPIDALAHKTGSAPTG
jgi:cytochrome bd ubiquinol oxidase subunit II